LAPYIGRHATQTAFWLALSGDRYAIQSTVADSSVLVYDLGAVGSAIAVTLALAGVGQLTLADAKPVAVSDQAFGPWYSPGTMGESRASALQRHCSGLNTQVTCQVLDAPPATPEEVAAVVHDSTLAVVCSDKTSVNAFQMFNEGCLIADRKWIRAVADHHMGSVGPLFVPRQTACFTCLRLRLLSNAPHPEEAAAVDRHLAAESDATPEVALLSGLAGAIANLLAVEVLKVLTGFSYPITTGAFLSLDLFTMELSRHEVLKLPRCPACGPFRHRSQAKIWDIDSGGTV